MSLFGKLNSESGQLKQDTAAGESRCVPPAAFTPIRTEDYKFDPKAELHWLVIEPDIFPGEEIVVVMKPEYLAEAEKENPGLVVYQLSEIKALEPLEHDIDFRKKIHLMKKTFGGWVHAMTDGKTLTV